MTGRLHVTADDLDGALGELLDTRNQMTRSVLGFERPRELLDEQPRND